MPTSKELTEYYLLALLEGRTNDLLGLFASTPTIDDPMAGRVAGREALADFVEDRRAWLASREARLEPFRTRRRGRRAPAGRRA
jgi:hypothetical protein